MYFQERYLKENAQFGSLAGLETIELPNKGLLSGLAIKVNGLNAVDTGAPDCWIHDRLKKIELIVNGSQVVKSIDGRQLIADMLYKKTPIWTHDVKNMSGGSTQEWFYINLGRYFHDLDYMLDLGQVNDPELRITTDFALTGHNGWTNGKAMTAKPYYDIVPHILREPEVTPRGYIKTSEIYRFTSGNSKKENMRIPRGPMYSNLYLQSFYASHGLTVDLDYVELNLNSDDVIPIRLNKYDLMADNVRKYGLMTVIQQFWATGAQAYPHPLEIGRLDGLCGGGDVGEVCRMDLWGYVTGVQLRNTTTAAVYAGPSPITAEYHGCLPFGIAAIPYFDPLDERFWIDSSKLGDFWVRVEEDAAADSGTVKLLADEVVTKYLS